MPMSFHECVEEVSDISHLIPKGHVEKSGKDMYVVPHDLLMAIV